MENQTKNQSSFTTEETQKDIYETILFTERLADGSVLTLSSVINLSGCKYFICVSPIGDNLNLPVLLRPMEGTRSLDRYNVSFSEYTANKLLLKTEPSLEVNNVVHRLLNQMAFRNTRYFVVRIS